MRAHRKLTITVHAVKPHAIEDDVVGLRASTGHVHEIEDRNSGCGGAGHLQANEANVVGTV